MPDMQTALTNALNNQLRNTINDWEKDDMQTTQTNTQPQGMNYDTRKKLFGVTNNVTRATFDYLKKHPNLTSAEICADMEKMGYKESSVGSLLAQFAKQGLAERDDRGRYITIVPEYRPLKAKKKEAKVVPKPVEVVAKRKYEKKATTGIGALLREKLEAMPTPSQDALDAAAYAMGGPQPAPKRVATIIRTQTPDDIIKNLTVFQARDLYDRLKEIFGG
jgi:hypothetical protein